MPPAPPIVGPDPSLCPSTNLLRDVAGDPRQQQLLSLEYRFDSSKGRGDFKTAIGVGKVIRGK